MGAGAILEVLDEELQGIKNAYYDCCANNLKSSSEVLPEGCSFVKPLKERLIAQYGDQISDKSSLGKMVSTNKAYSMAKTPIILDEETKKAKPNPQHRVVQDDIGWGLCVLLSIAERLECENIQIPTDMIRHCIQWHEKI